MAAVAVRAFSCDSGRSPPQLERSGEVMIDKILWKMFYCLEFCGYLVAVGCLYKRVVSIQVEDCRKEIGEMVGTLKIEYWTFHNMRPS